METELHHLSLIESVEANVVDCRWYNGVDCVGIVKVYDFHNDEYKYYIGVSKGGSEYEAAQHVAKWGAKFPAGAVVFGDR